MTVVVHTEKEITVLAQNLKNSDLALVRRAGNMLIDLYVERVALYETIRLKDVELACLEQRLIIANDLIELQKSTSNNQMEAMTFIWKIILSNEETKLKFLEAMEVKIQSHIDQGDIELADALRDCVKHLGLLANTESVITETENSLG